MCNAPHLSIHPYMNFIYLFYKHQLGICSVLGTLLGTGYIKDWPLPIELITSIQQCEALL